MTDIMVAFFGITLGVPLVWFLAYVTDRWVHDREINWTDSLEYLFVAMTMGPVFFGVIALMIYGCYYRIII